MPRVQPSEAKWRSWKLLPSPADQVATEKARAEGASMAPQAEGGVGCRNPQQGQDSSFTLRGYPGARQGSQGRETLQQGVWSVSEL